MLPLLVKLFATQVLSPDSVISESNEAVDANAVFVKEVAALSSTTKVDSWIMLPGFVPVQTFFVYITHFLESVYEDATLF